MNTHTTPPSGFTTEPEILDVQHGDIFFVFNFKAKKWEQLEWKSGTTTDPLKLYAWPCSKPVRTIGRHRFCKARLFRGEDGVIRLHQGNRSIVWEDFCFFNGWPFPNHVKNMTSSFSWDEYGNIREN